MKKIIGCIDSSSYSDRVCDLLVWAHSKLHHPVALLHVVTEEETQPETPLTDMTGQIGLGAKSKLLSALAEIDRENNKLAMKKGQLILSHAQADLTDRGVPLPEMMHRRGSLVDTLQSLSEEASLIVIGKRGENQHNATAHLGSNLERVARALHQPVLLATQTVRPVRQILLAYDGSEPADKALDFVADSPLFDGVDCHLLHVQSASDEKAQKKSKAHKDYGRFNQAKARLESSHKVVQAKQVVSHSVEAAIDEYITHHAIDLLAIGAYGHSPIRSFFLGSTTTAIIRQTKVPLLLCR